MSSHTDNVVLKWCSFDGDKISGYYRLRCVSYCGYEWSGVVEWRKPGGKWEEEEPGRSLPFTDLAIALDREQGVTLPRWGSKKPRRSACREHTSVASAGSRSTTTKR